MVTNRPAPFLQGAEMSLRDEMAGDLAEIIADLPSSILFSGATIAATISPLTREDQTETNGVFQNFDVQAVAAITAFPVVPMPNDACWVTDSANGLDNVRFIIKSVMRGGEAYTLTAKRGRA